MTKNVLDILEALEADGSRLAKEAILTEHKKNELLKQVFMAAGDPYTVYFITKFKMPAACSTPRKDDEVLPILFAQLARLSERSVTGNEAKTQVESFFCALSERQQKWCSRILLKNLRCGVQESTINKIWPGLIATFEVALAVPLKTSFSKEKGIVIEEIIGYPVRAEPKLDGLRCVCVKKNGVATFYTRNGNVLETLPTIQTFIEKLPEDNVVFDGEAMAANWNESNSILMSSKGKKDDKDLVFHVFDSMPLSEWTAQSCLTPNTKRVATTAILLAHLPKGAPVRQVQGQMVRAQSELMAFYNAMMLEGYEGVMLKDPHAGYDFKRSKAVRKMKPMMTFEGVVVGSYAGRVGGKREEGFGGFEVLLPNGIITKVGGGFSDKLLAEINAAPEKWVGRVVEIEGQPEAGSKDGLTEDGKVRFPVYSRERDKKDVDPKVIEAYENRGYPTECAQRRRSGGSVHRG